MRFKCCTKSITLDRIKTINLVCSQYNFPYWDTSLCCLHNALRLNRIRYLALSDTRFLRLTVLRKGTRRLEIPRGRCPCRFSTSFVTHVKWISRVPIDCVASDKEHSAPGYNHVTGSPWIASKLWVRWKNSLVGKKRWYRGLCASRREMI